MRYLLQDIFADTVKKFPNKIAIIEESGRSTTYSELDNIANQYANYYLQNKKPDDPPYIGVLSFVAIESIAAIIGALKIGYAYIPLDEASPFERLQHIINNTKLRTIVIHDHFVIQHEQLLKHKPIRDVLYINKLEINNNLASFPTDPPPILNQVSDDLAYILHSSGSTGIPKGIMLTHRNARTFVDWMHEEFKLTSEDIVMSRAPFKFDLSVFDIFNTFKAGATLACFNWVLVREISKQEAYVNYMKQMKATILYTTPSTFISLMNAGGLNGSELNLRTIMYAGEPFPIPQLRRLKVLLPNTKIANIYGPTETNIITYYWIERIPEDDNYSIPLGYPVTDTEIIVVSEDRKSICGPNEIGELWCRGGTVTLGYLGMPEKTNQCLVQSPFHSYPAKFWRTGDFGFKDLEGVLHYKGRRDHMVKVKGFRIEIGEVESAIAKHEDVDQFCVVPLEDHKYGNRLYCFYSTLSKQNICENVWKDFLSKLLPDYMIPCKFFYRLILPQTSSEKIDRIRLAACLEDNITYAK